MSKASLKDRVTRGYHSSWVVFLMFAAWGRSASADALDHWHWRNPLPSSVGLKGIAFGNSKFVGVGDGGWILTSTNQQDWTTTYSGTPMQFHNVIASEKGFLAFGYWETNGMFLHSTDGTEWESQTAPQAGWMADAVFARGQFVGVGLAQTRNGGPSAATSPDGRQWTPLDFSSFPDQNLNGVAYGHDRWVAVGDRGMILTSTDGELWFSSESGAVEDLKDVVFGDGQFVAVGTFSGTSTVLVSPDGLEWATAWSRKMSGTDSLDLSRVAAGQPGFVAMGAGRLALYSPDGQTWTEHSLGQVLLHGGVAYGDGRWVAGGRALMPTTTFTTGLFTSVDGRQWMDHTGGVPSVTQNGLAFGNGFHVAVGTAGRIARSAHGVDWSLVAALGNTTDLARVAHAGGRFLAMGSQGNNALLLVSEDGQHWTNHTSVVGARLLGAAYGNGRSVVVSGSNILWSTRGDDWQLSPSTSASNLFDVVFDGRQFVAAGRNGTLQTSPDGVEWSTQPSPTNASLRSIAFSGSAYVAVGAGVILVSTNGQDWAVSHTGDFALRSVAYGGGWFVATGMGLGAFVSDVLLTSSDGQHWFRRDIGGNLSPSCLAFDGRSFFLGGAGGAILQSDPVVTTPAPASLALRWMGEIQLSLTGEAGRRYTVESTTNLGTDPHWAPVATVRAESTSVRLTPPLLPGVARQFYRARGEP